MAQSNMPGRGSRGAALLAVLVVTVGAAASAALGLPNAAREDTRASAPAQDALLPYNGKFVFARIRTPTRNGGFRRGRGGGGDPCNLPEGWGHDYPCAERSLMTILSHVTTVQPGSTTSNIISLGDPELLKYPIAYISHPGQFEMNEAETKNLRDYLLKGGFLILDDFPGDEWGPWATQMQRALPELVPVVIDASEPVFHSFFDFESLDNVSLSRGYGTPQWIGYFEDNNPKKRLLVVANYLGDLGENWEASDRGFSIIPEEANEAFKFGVNYIIYGLTH